MDERKMGVDYDGLDRLLGALAQSVAERVDAKERGESPALSVPRAAWTAWREPAAPVAVTTLPRGVPLEVVFRAVLKHFLPGAATVLFLPIALLRLLDPFDWITVAGPAGVLVTTAIGFGLGLLALSPGLYPHSNPDGRRSERAGIAAPFLTLVIGMALSGYLAPLPTAIEFASVYAIAALSGLTLAVVAYAPWLRPTSRIARASAPDRERRFRATVTTGLVGAAAFGVPGIARALYLGASGRIAADGLPWPFLAEVTLGGAFTGFVIGVVFAVILRAAYRRVAVDELNAWRVGLWGATVGLLPVLSYFWVWYASGGQRTTADPASALFQTLIAWCLPGFALAFGAVKLAQRSGE